MNNEWFKKTLPESWEDESKTLRECKQWCTKGRSKGRTKK